MKYFYILVCVVALLAGLNGCAVNSNKSNSFSRISKKSKTFAQTLTAELASLAKKPVRTTVESRQEQARMEQDNSVVETIYDSFGNKTESRVFSNDSLLKMVVVRTSAQGQKQALIYGQNGEVKTAPQNMLDKVLTAVAGEIAKTVEIFGGRKENVMLAKLQTPPMTADENFTAVNYNPQAASENIQTAPVTEKIETPKQNSQPNESETKTVETQNDALKLRAAVQMPKANRSKVATKDLIAKAY